MTELEVHAPILASAPDSRSEKGEMETWLWQQLQLGGVAPETEQNLQSLFICPKVAFSKHEADNGCSETFIHASPTRAAVPLRERYQGIPPSLDQEVIDILQKMQESKVIRKSTNP